MARIRRPYRKLARKPTNWIALSVDTGINLLAASTLETVVLFDPGEFNDMKTVLRMVGNIFITPQASQTEMIAFYMIYREVLGGATGGTAQGMAPNEVFAIGHEEVMHWGVITQPGLAATDDNVMSKDLDIKVKRRLHPDEHRLVFAIECAVATRYALNLRGLFVDA